MATVNLSSIFKKTQNPNSSIPYKYQDFNILSMEVLKNDNIGSKKEKTDLVVSYDIGAVTNALVNILTTRKKQKILDPEFGLRIEDYLFEPVTELVGERIKEEITYAITNFEPRVALQRVNVVPYPEDNKYEIDLYYSVPSLKQTIRLKGKLENGVIEIL